MPQLITDLRILLRHIATDPSGWLYFQGYCLAKAVLPHDRNNDFRKLTTTALFVVWIALTFGVGPGQEFAYYDVVFGISMLILGQQWELEKIRFGPFQFTNETDDEE